MAPLINLLYSGAYRIAAGGFKDKVVCIFKTNTPKDYDKQTLYGRGRIPSKPKTQMQSEDKIIKSIINISKLKKENKKIKNRKIRALFEQEGDYHKPR